MIIWDTISKLPIKNLLIICLTILAIASIRGCHMRNLEIDSTNDAWSLKLEMEQDNAATLTREKDKLGREVVTQKQLVVTEKQAKEMALLDNQRLKKIQSHVSVSTTSEVTDVLAAFVEPDDPEPIFVLDTSGVEPVYVEDTNYIKIPKRVELITPHYKLLGQMVRQGLKIDTMAYYDDMTITIGFERPKGFKNLLKKKQPVVVIENQNPHTTITHMENFVIVKDEKKFYETTWFKFTIGAVVGAATIMVIKR